MKKFLFIICLLVQYLVSGAQSLQPDTLLARTARQYSLLPQEKIYIHTDKPTYIAGEKIWAKAYVVDGVTHVPTTTSRYVYLVLQNPFQETVTQVRLRPDKEGAIYGNIPLPEDLPQGEYILTAYTRYMENEGEEYFFRKRVFISSLLSKSIRIKSETNGSNLLIRFIDPLTQGKKEVANCVVKLLSGYTDVKPESEGFSVKLHSKKEKIAWVKAGNYQEFIPVSTNPDYEIDFLPEGGSLIAGAVCRVAFKALNEQGQGEAIRGNVKDERDSLITEFSTAHRGMGVFSFIPEAGKEYTAVCTDNREKTKRFRLPPVQKGGHALHINQVKEKIYAQVLSSPDEILADTLFIFAHQRGWPQKIGTWSKGIPYLIFDSKDFVQGAAHFLLTDTKGSIQSERMVFIHRPEPVNGEVLPNATNYKAREKMTLQLHLKDAQGNPWQGDCSVAITDNADVMPDSCVNILSSLLLSSDLKGYIEAPAWYFEKKESENRKQMLDILMMTQGWRRYDLQQVWQGTFHFPKIPPERSQSITGKVFKRVSRQPIEGSAVHLMAPLIGLSAEASTDSTGKFCFENFEYPDSTIYWVSAYTSKGKDNLVIQADKETYPALVYQIPPYCASTSNEYKNIISQQYLTKADRKMTLEKGIRHIFLDEVTITAPRKTYRTEYEKIIGAQVIREKEISQSGVLDAGTLLRQKVPGLTMAVNKDNKPLLLIRNEETLILLDGVMQNSDYSEASGMALSAIMRNLNPKDIEQIDVIKGPQATGYHSKFSNIIAITTKQGGKQFNAQFPVTNLEQIQPLGYQLPVEFYTPRYDTVADKENKNPDLRTTIHWQPHVPVKNGEATIECYTADGPANYTIVAEGVGNEGTLLHLERSIGY